MPKYKLVLTVQDSYGMTKEIEAGTVDAEEYVFTEKDIQKVASELDNTYAFATEAEAKTWDEEVHTQVVEKLPEMIETEEALHKAITDVVEKNVDTIKYDGFKKQV